MSTYLRVLRHRDFRLLFLGQSASMVGDQVVFVAMALFITQRTGSPTDLGLVLAAGSLPLVVLILFGGVWADRLPRHRIMIVADLVRASVQTTVAVLIFTGAVRIWQLVVAQTLFGAAMAFFQPAYKGLVPQTVSEERIQDALALTESMSNIAVVVGPALATALVLGVGAGEAFAFDGVTFMISALLLLGVRPRPRGGTTAAQSVRHELRDGWREVRSRTWVWVTIAVFTGAVLCLYSQWTSLAPVIARDVYGSAGVFGLLESAAGVGAVAGALIGVRWKPARPLRTGMILVLGWPVEAIVFAIAAPVALVAVLAMAMGFGFALLMIWWETLLAQHIPPAALSRVSAWDWMGSLALIPVGYAVAGPLAAALGPRTVLGAGAVIGLVLLGLGLAPRSVRGLAFVAADGSAEGSTEHLDRDVPEELGGEAEVADVDALVGAVDER